MSLLLTLTLIDGKDASAFSLVAGEEEVLVLPGAKLALLSRIQPGFTSFEMHWKQTG